MQYQILVERSNQNDFVASVIGLPDCVAKGNTEEEAIAGVRQALQSRLSQAKAVTIEVDPPSLQAEKGPLSVARFRDDPTFDNYMEKLQQYRREANAKPFDNELAVEEATSAG